MINIEPAIQVLYLHLKHFSRVYTGLQLYEVTIDFEKLSEDISLFIGRNGTGKTSILHCIHPFAYNNTIGDNISNAEFIMEHEDGEKIIRYKIYKDFYEIRHLYLRKPDDSITVKSFITKNGSEELNPSGTVNTFEDIISDIFELDKTYLRLLSLGNTVEGFVEYTGSARKQTVIEIFSKLDIFKRYYKNATQNARNTKSILNNVTAKLDKYRNYDVTEAKKIVLQIEQKLEDLEDQVRSTSLEMGSVSQKISSNKEFIEDYQTKKDRLMELLSKIDLIKGRLQSQKDVPSLQSDLSNISKKIEDQKIHKGSFEANLKISLDYMQSLKADLEETESTLEKMVNDVDLEELDKAKANLEAVLSTITIPVDTPNLDRESLVRASIFLEELKGLCIDFITNVEHEEIIADTAKKFFVDSSLLSKSEKRYDSLLETLRRAEFIRGTHAITKIDPIPANAMKCDKAESCPYVQFYNEYMDMVSKKTENVDREIAKKQSDVDIAKDVVEIGRIASRLSSYIKRNKDALQLPSEVFDPVSFIDMYMKQREVANMDLLATIINIAENQEKQADILTQLEEIETKRKNNQSIRGHYDTLKERATTIRNKMEQSKGSIDYCQRELPMVDAEIAKLEDVRKRIEKELELVQELESYRGEVSTLRSELASMESKSGEIDHLQERARTLQKQIDMLMDQINTLRKQKEDTSMELQTVAKLKEEQYTLTEQYAEAESIRDAVSPTKGLPLHRIKKYVKKYLLRMVNELLELVYGRELYIDINEVTIDDDVFTIPYRRHGVLISDISHASDGERAVMSLAFSLSLARITSKKYNIMLLDEMDTTLDVYSRGKYIDMIVAYMKLIHAKQIFLISHNSMFDNYPVNVLMTSDMATPNVAESNIVKLWKGGNGNAA